MNAILTTVSLNGTGTLLTIQLAASDTINQSAPALNSKLTLHRDSEAFALTVVPKIQARRNDAHCLQFEINWPQAETLFCNDSYLTIETSSHTQPVLVHIPTDSLIRQDRRKLDFFVHKVRSPGARRFDRETTLYLAKEAYNWLPNSGPDRLSALIVVMYRWLELEVPLPTPERTWVENAVRENLALESNAKMGIDSRWGYSLRIANFYWLMKHESTSKAEEFILAEHMKISPNFAIESVPNFFKMAMILGALALVKSNPAQVFTLLSAMNQMLGRHDLWATPINFFQSLDRKNLVSNYHEVFKMAIMLEPLKLKREWVQEHDMLIETSFLGDPGRQLLRKILQDHGIKFK